jgi:hypothetical protein
MRKCPSFRKDWGFGVSLHFLLLWKGGFRELKRCRTIPARGSGVSPDFLLLPQDWESQRGLKIEHTLYSHS